jgi:hypothetical protein
MRTIARVEAGTSPRSGAVCVEGAKSAALTDAARLEMRRLEEARQRIWAQAPFRRIG